MGPIIGKSQLCVLFQLNDEENVRVAERRKERLQKEAEERKIQIAKELEEFNESERVRLLAVDKEVEKHISEMKNIILMEDIEKAIETALANPLDLEYAIDKQGHIFRGRTTKSKKVDEKDYEKIPVASDMS